MCIYFSRECGVAAEVIQGFSKGRGWKEIATHSISDDPDHGWNAVFIHNEWRLVDCTWDSRYLLYKPLFLFFRRKYINVAKYTFH